MAGLSRQQRSTLQAICTALNPRLPPEPGDCEPVFANSAEAFAVEERLQRRLADAAAAQRHFVRCLLRWIELPLVCCLATGFARPFSSLQAAQRETVLRRWSRSRLPPMRSFFQSVKRLTLYCCYAQPLQGGPNPTWEALGYPASNPAPPGMPATTVPAIDIGSSTRDLNCEVLVIGSGAGASVVAAHLAGAGKDVLILEKGESLSPEQWGAGEWEANRRMMDKFGGLGTADLAMVVLSGSTVGGGTAINWMTSLPPPEPVLQQWSAEFGFRECLTREFRSSVDAVLRRLNVTTSESRLNEQNRLLKQGCDQLGYRVELIPRNASNCTVCDFCSFGCRSGAKMDSRQTYLQDAIRAGARLATGTRVERLVVRHSRVVGADVRITGGGRTSSVRVSCGAAVAGGGAIQSAALLLRSGVGSRIVGRQLFLHPTTAIAAFYDQPVRPWEGPPQTVLCDQFADIDGKGYGTRLEVAPVHPGFAAMALAWDSAAAHKRLMQQLAWMANTIVITRDRDGGQVRVSRSGEVVVRYRLSRYDADHMRIGVSHALKLHRASGARLLIGPHQWLNQCRREDDLDRFLKRVAQTPMWPNVISLFSAHQMSTCRIAASSKLGAFNPDGRSYEVQNLFVADASALPTGCGVNPMITIMSLAHFLGPRIAGQI